MSTETDDSADQGPAPGTAKLGENYEFTEAQNAVILPLSDKMSFVGLILIILGALGIIGGIADSDPFGVVQGSVMVIIGVWTRKASSAFRLIVDTEGSDIANLMNALEELKKLYHLQYWVLIIAGALVAVGIMVLLFAVGDLPQP